MDTSPLFAAFSAEERFTLGAQFRFLEIDAGVRLVEEGQPGEMLFVLLAGRASVVRAGEAIATLGPGDLFGEISLLDRVPATATVELTTKAFVLGLPRAVFAQVIVTHPPLLDYVGELADTRKRALRLPVT
jgi:CRP-like cAMP-binding protein